MEECGRSNEAAAAPWIASTALGGDDFLDQLGAEGPRAQRGVGDDAGKRSVQLADVGVDAMRKNRQRVAVGDLDVRLADQAS